MGSERVIYQAETPRGLRAERFAKEQQLRCLLMPQEHRQNHARTRLRAKSQIDERKLEPRGISCIYEVTVEQHGGADSNGDSRDSSDHGFFSCSQHAQIFEGD